MLLQVSKVYIPLFFSTSYFNAAYNCGDKLFTPGMFLLLQTSSQDINNFVSYLIYVCFPFVMNLFKLTRVLVYRVSYFNKITLLT